MNCERFLFEVSYLPESGEGADLAPDALCHLSKCSSCKSRFRQIKYQRDSLETPVLVSQRLHQAIDSALTQKSAFLMQRASSRQMCLQMAFTCLILVGSIIGIAYQNHPTVTPSVIAHR